MGGCGLYRGMTKTTLVSVSMFLVAASTLTACKKESSCSDDSLAALRSLRSAVSEIGVSFDGETLERVDEQIDAVKDDLSFDGSLASAVGYLREDISKARELIDYHGDIEDGDLSGLDDLASSQGDLERQADKVMRAIDSADEYCEPR